MKRLSQQDIANLMENVIFDKLRVLRAAGQREYAHEGESPFRNFETLSTELQTTREQVLWIYMRKHLDGILAYIRGHRSQREDVRGRIADCMVYLALLWGMVEEVDPSELPHDWISEETIDIFHHENQAPAR